LIAMSVEDVDLEDYSEGYAAQVDSKSDAKTKGSYASTNTSSFRDFLLKPELLQAIADAGFEHPSEVQQEAIPQAMLGTDMICQAKSGMGKTAVFVVSTLHQIEPAAGQIDTLVLAHNRELAYQIAQEFERFKKYLPEVKPMVVYGGIDIKQNQKVIKEEQPNIIIGTPGRVQQLIEEGTIKVDKLKRFIMDECDQLIDSLDMRQTVQKIFRATPKEKQVLMFSATISEATRKVCLKFTQNPMSIFIDDESKLTLHGLAQYYVKLEESKKSRQLSDILDAMDFNQVVIFVKSVERCKQLAQVLVANNFPAMEVHGRLKQEERVDRYQRFKDGKARILVSTDIWGRGIDIERVNIVINYDMPCAADREAGTATISNDSDTYLHRVNRAGRFGTKGMAISFIASEADSKVLEAVQERFEVQVPEMPAQIDTSTYMSA